MFECLNWLIIMINKFVVLIKITLMVALVSMLLFDEQHYKNNPNLKLYILE